MHRLRLQRVDELLQPWPVTAPDRHPALFALAAERLAGTAEPRILSFGCSTGEEPITLARYLPQARIDGLDINPRNVAEARRKNAPIFVIGGAELYRQALPLADRLYLTEVDEDFAGDTFFPEVSPEEWQEHERQPLLAASGIRLAFVEYRRKAV